MRAIGLLLLLLLHGFNTRYVIHTLQYNEE